MIEKLREFEVSIIPELLNNNSWNGVDVKNTQPRRFIIYTEYDGYVISFIKTFYTNIEEILIESNSDDICIHFLDGFWELYNNMELKSEKTNYYENDFYKKSFLIKANDPFYYRSYIKKNWVYSFVLSKKPLYLGENLKEENKNSLIKSAKILIKL